LPFTTPIPFAEALQFLARKQLLPTDLSSAALREVGADIRRQALFSARNTQASILGEIHKNLGALLEGQSNTATAAEAIQASLKAIGYRPESGFRGETELGIPPADAGSLRDLSSDQRVKLVLETNQRMAQNYGRLVQGNEEDALWLFPAWELVRIYPRTVERGFRRVKDGLVADPDNAWETRWTTAGGELVDGRLVALKGAEVWANLGDSALFDDGLDNPFPPYAFNSGMGWREVPREEAVALGLIDADEAIEARTPRFAAALDSELEGRDGDWVQRAMEAFA
jgi:hypothetical protein